MGRRGSDRCQAGHQRCLQHLPGHPGQQPAGTHQRNALGLSALQQLGGDAHLQLPARAALRLLPAHRSLTDHQTPYSAEQTMHRGERRFGPFLRSITLPSNVMADAIDASSQDGLLLITVPKPKEAHAKRIQVHPGVTHTTRTPTALGSYDENHS